MMVAKKKAKVYPMFDNYDLCGFYVRGHLEDQEAWDIAEAHLAQEYPEYFEMGRNDMKGKHTRVRMVYQFPGMMGYNEYTFVYYEEDEPKRGNFAATVFCSL